MSNPESAGLFANYLVARLEECFQTTRKKIRGKRESMWEKFFKLTSSDSFAKKWKQQLESLHVIPTPIFFQFVTDSMMKSLVKERHPVPIEANKEAGDQPSVYVHPLDYEECNVLRYMAGYVIKALLKKMKKSAHPLKDTLTLCLKEMIENNKEGT